MVYTKRKVETDRDRFGGYASPYSQYSRTEEAEQSSFDNDENSAYNPYASVYDWENESNSATSTLENEIDTPIETETPSYEYEREYVSNNNIETNEEKNPFKTSSFERLDIERVKPRQKLTYKFNTHGKILLTVYSAICMILVAFVIFNAVQISNIKAVNKSNAEIISAKQEVINVLEDEYEYLGSDEGVSNRLSNDNYFKNFVKQDDSNTVTIYLEDGESVPTYHAPSNWFDDICEFFSNLLG